MLQAILGPVGAKARPLVLTAYAATADAVVGVSIRIPTPTLPGFHADFQAVPSLLGRPAGELNQQGLTLAVLDSS